MLKGVAVTIDPVDAFKLPAGAHVYEAPPLAVNVVEVPEHIGVAVALTPNVGDGITLITILSILLQPAPLEPVTVYVVVTFGNALTLAPVFALKPVEGDHVYVVAPLA